MSEIVIIMGPPASGKSTEVAKYPHHVRLNRDILGGRTIDLLPRMVNFLKMGDSVVLDNIFAKAADRKPFLDAAKQLGVPAIGIFMNTSIEECQINVLHRMQVNHGRIFMAASDMKGIKEPGTFPIAVLFKWRQESEIPILSEGFVEIKRVSFTRKWDDHYKNKAILLDYDGTLRTVKNGEYKFPTSPNQITILPGRSAKLQQLQSEGYKLLGVSNQSGIEKEQLTEAAAIACFQRTNELLGVDIDVAYCPHRVPPISCYCRKSQVGMGVRFIEKYALNPALCICVGDQGTDRAFANRLGIPFQTPKQFFGE